MPRKNILDLGGKPLLAWTIQAALKSEYLDKVLVSSDDDEILEASLKYGANILKRPEELASDTAISFNMVKHAIKLEKEKYDYVVLLQPTSPLRNEKHIDEAINLLEQKNADAIISVCKMEHSPLWANILGEDLSMENFLKDEILNKRSQDLDTYYRLNGAIYICKTDKLMENESFFLKENIFAYEMSKEDSVDIDDRFDFDFAHFLIGRK